MDRVINFSPPDIGIEEVKAVEKVLKSGWITTGPETKKFEHDISTYIGVNKSVCLNSATASMELTLRVLGIGEGDEVITTAYTYTATAAVIHHTGATIKLIDTAPNSFEMDYEKLDSEINERTKAIIAVDIAGKICDYEKIHEIIERKKSIFKPDSNLQKQFNRIIILADAAHSFGATKSGLLSGQFADFTCFSFHAVKNLTTGEGGAVTWKNRNFLNDEDIYKQYMHLSLHGQSKDALSKSQSGGWEYDIVAPLYKCNMTDLMASIGRVQIDRYPNLLETRHHLVSLYDQQLDFTRMSSLTHLNENYNSSCHLYLLRIDEINEKQRNELIVELAERGIPCNVHYKPLPMLSAYKNLGFNIEDYPNAYAQYKNQITLPLHTQLSDDDIKYISKNVNELVEKVRCN